MPDVTVDSLVRVFISYAHDSPEHVERVRQLWLLLRSKGIDAQLDLPAAEQRQDWPEWMLREIRLARFVLVIASPAYRQRAEGDAPAGEGRGVQYEASLIREEVYGNPKAALNRILPVILPGGSPSDIPAWLGPTSTTYYTVSEFTERGAEKLLRLLTGQPYETVPPLGRRPVLPPRAGRRATGTGGAAQDPLLGLVRRLADRSQVRNEAMVQADVRQLLLTGSLGLDPDDLGAELEHRRRIDLALRSAVIEVRGDLRRGALAEAAEELVGYLAVRGDQTGWEYVGVLTDGAEWHLYSHLQGKPKHLMSLTVDPADPNVDELLRWLDEALADGPKLEPTPQEIVRRLGAESRSHTYLARELARLYEQNRDLPTVKVKRDLWAKLLTTALGTNFTDEDSLFIDHTLLVMIAKVIGHAVVGFHPEASHITARRIVSGELFTAAQIGGVVEGDFFDWIIEVPGGDRFVKHLARRLARFAWEQVEHDVMKVLYESIISRRIRHLLGEYYTPGWLAEAIIAECVDDPLAQRVLDASCGSGTFLFHAVRRYLAAAEDAGMSGPEAIQGVTANVIGIDVHPVAVTLARVTYLLAIGMHRLYVENRPRFAVPVYLGDSLRWGQEETLWSYGGLSVPTAADHEMFLNEPDFSDEIEFSEKLKFPERVIGDARRFDMLVNHMAQRAVQRDRGSPVPSLTVVFRRFEIVEDDRPVLERTFQIMCELHDNWKDHIWGYYVRNLARPLWLARPDNRIDVLVGNPPWLAYRYMTRNQQASFRRMSMERGLWRGATVATNQDLSALFVVRCVELYLRPGGRFGYVMPWATLSRGQYAGFRTGDFPVRSEPVKVSFNQPWDLQRVKPAFFPLPASVVFGRRQNGNADAAALPQVPQAWSGRFATHTASWAQAAPSLGRTIGEPPPPSAQRSSPYAKRFSQGATVVPRFLFVVEPDTTGPLGTGAGRRAVRSLRAANEKTPWKALLTLHGIVEEQFIRPLYVGNSILPFRCLQPAEAIIPWDGEQLLPGDDELLDWYPGLAEWWHTAEGAWHGNRSSERLSLLEQLDYRGKLSQQLPAPRYRVVYSASGMYLAAAVVSDPTAVIEHRLYWGSAENLNEARFLTAILNSNTLTMAVRPLQARGEHNPRHFDKSVFQLPIPLYDAHDVAHRWLVELAERSEQVAANVDLPDVRFEAQRRRVRKALAEDGVAADIDAIVKELLIR